MINSWTLEETIVAFNAYCKIPFKDSNKYHPLIIEYAKLIGRSPSALNMKIGNLGRLDPKLKEKGIVGLSHGAKIEEEVWNKFYKSPDTFAYESECIIAKYRNLTIEQTIGTDNIAFPYGEERMSYVKQRVNQRFFRDIIMSTYDFRCCISGIQNTELLEACHILSWRENTTNRCNPENGLCMNVLFHKAYDKYLIGITPDYDIVVSDEMFEETTEENFRKYLKSINGKKIISPKRFAPNKFFLDLHYQKYLNH